MSLLLLFNAPPAGAALSGSAQGIGQTTSPNLTTHVSFAGTSLGTGSATATLTAAHAALNGTATGIGTASNSTTFYWTQTKPIPGMTNSMDHPYSGAAVGSDGQTIFVARATGTGSDFDTFQVAVRSGGTWYTQSVTPTDVNLANERVLYYNIVPTTGTGAYVVATHAATWANLGWTAPPSAFGFAYNGTKAYYSSDWTSVAPTVVTILDVAPSGSNIYVTDFANCAVTCNSGSGDAVYVLSAYANATDAGATGDFQARYARISGTTVTNEGIASNLYGYGANTGKYIVDSSQRLWCVTANPPYIEVFACDNTTGAPTSTRTRLAVSPAISYGLIIWAGPHSGTSLQSYADLLYVGPTNDAMSFLRIDFSSGTPTIALNEEITSGLSSDSGEGGNPWGYEKVRLTRTPNGTLYAIGPAAGVDNDDKISHLYQRTGPGTWVDIYQLNSGRESEEVMNGGDGTLYLEGCATGTTEDFTVGSTTKPPFLMVQSSGKLRTSAGGNLSTSGSTFTANPTPGNLITCAGFAWDSPGPTATAADCHDSSGTPVNFTLEPVGDTTAFSGHSIAMIWHLVVPTGGLTLPLINATSATYRAVEFIEWSGNDVAANVLDASTSSTSSGSTVTSGSTGTINTGANAGLILACLAQGGSTSNEGIVTTGTNFSTHATEQNAAAYGGWSEDYRLANTKSQTALQDSWTWTAAASYATVIASFNAVPSAIALSGSAKGTGSASASLTTSQPLAGTATGTGAASATLTAASDALSGSAEGIGQSSASLITHINLAATAQGVGSASGVLSAATQAISGTSEGIGSATATLTAHAAALSGTATGIGSASATATEADVLSGSAKGTGQASATLTLPAASFSGSAQGIGQASAALTTSEPLLATATGTGTASATLTPAVNALTGAAQGVGQASATLTPAPDTLSGTAQGVGQTSANLTQKVALSGSAQGIGQATANLTGTAGSFSGVAQGQGIATASLTTSQPLLSTATGTGQVTGTLTNADALIGTAEGIGSGTLVAGSAPLAGIAKGTGSGTATLTVPAGALSGTAQGTGQAAAPLTTRIDLLSTAEGIGTTAGTLQGAAGAFAGTSTGTGSGTASLATSTSLSGSAQGIGQTTATLTGAHAPLSGTAEGIGSGSGQLATTFLATAEGIGSATGNLSGQSASLSGTSQGAGSATATLTNSLQLSGSTEGTGAASATLTTPAAALTGSASATGSATATLVTSQPLNGSANGTGQATANLTLPAATLSGVAEGIGSVAGVLGTTILGTATGTGSASATLSQSVSLSGSAEGTANAQATLSLPAAQLVGSAEGIGSASGALGVALVGSASGMGTASGTLSQSVDLEGTAEGIGQAQATITPVQAVLSGTCLGLGSGFGDLRPALIPGHHSARVIPRRGHITSTSAARRATVGITLAHNAVVKPGRNARITTNDHNVEVVPL